VELQLIRYVSSGNTHRQSPDCSHRAEESSSIIQSEITGNESDANVSRMSNSIVGGGSSSAAGSTLGRASRRSESWGSYAHREQRERLRHRSWGENPQAGRAPTPTPSVTVSMASLPGSQPMTMHASTTASTTGVDAVGVGMDIYSAIGFSKPENSGSDSMESIGSLEGSTDSGFALLSPSFDTSPGVCFGLHILNINFDLFF
jgi:hypothetical protein